MTLLALTAVRSPGVSTAALALALSWPTPSLLVEADPAGSALHTGFLRNRGSLERGLLGAALAARQRPGPTAVLEHAVRLDQDGRRLLIAGLTEPGQAAVVTAGWPALLSALRALPAAQVRHDVLVDAGRLGHRDAPTAVLADADLIILAVRPKPGEVHFTRSHAQALRQQLPGASVAALVIGYARDMPGATLSALFAQAEVPVLGALPHDESGAAVLRGDRAFDRGADRTALLRSARALAERVAALGAPASREGARDVAVR
jgi:hypothetical protein